MRDMSVGSIYHCDGCGMEVTVTRGGDCTCLACCGSEMKTVEWEEGRGPGQERSQEPSGSAEPEREAETDEFSFGC
jgi:hypothetical protein